MNLTMLLAVSALIVTSAGTPNGVPQPNPTRTVPIADTLENVVIPDPYRWLENGESPEVEAWSDAENARTRAYLDAIPGRQVVKARLTALVKATSPSISELRAAGGRVFALYNDPALQQPELIVMDGDADPGTRRVLLDPNTEGHQGSVAIDWFEPSPDGAKLAVSLSINGSEDGSLHIYEVASGHEIEPVIPRVQYPTAGGSLAWTNDSSAFWYTRYPGDASPAADGHSFQQVYFHQLGGNWATDPLALSTENGVPRTGEIYLDNRYGGPAALASVQLGDGGEWRHFVLRPGQPALRVGEYTDKVVAASIGPDGALYGVSAERP